MFLCVRVATLMCSTGSSSVLGLAFGLSLGIIAGVSFVILVYFCCRKQNEIGDVNCT